MSMIINDKLYEINIFFLLTETGLLGLHNSDCKRGSFGDFFEHFGNFVVTTSD